MHQFARPRTSKLRFSIFGRKAPRTADRQSSVSGISDRSIRSSGRSSRALSSSNIFAESSDLAIFVSHPLATCRFSCRNYPPTFEASLDGRGRVHDDQGNITHSTERSPTQLHLEG